MFIPILLCSPGVILLIAVCIAKLQPKRNLFVAFIISITATLLFIKICSDMQLVGLILFTGIGGVSDIVFYITFWVFFLKVINEEIKPTALVLTLCIIGAMFPLLTVIMGAYASLTVKTMKQAKNESMLILSKLSSKEIVDSIDKLSNKSTITVNHPWMQKNWLALDSGEKIVWVTDRMSILKVQLAEAEFSNDLVTALQQADNKFKIKAA